MSRWAAVLWISGLVLPACGSSQTGSAPPAGATAATPTASAGAEGTAAAAIGTRRVPTVHAALAHWRLPVPRYRTMAVATGRYIFLLGGLDVGGSTVGTVYRIDTRRGRTKRAGSLAAPTHGGAALLLHRRAYVFGGAGPPIYDLVQEYDPTSGRTRVAGHLPGVRADVAAAAVGRQVVVAAGYDGLGPLDTVLATADERPGGASNAILRFNPATHRVLRAGRLPEHVSDGGVATIGNTTYILGGINGRPLTAVCVVRIG